MNQVSVVEYSTLKAAGSITSITLGADGDTITVVCPPYDTTIWSLSDIKNQLTVSASQVTNFTAVIADCGSH